MRVRPISHSRRFSLSRGPARQRGAALITALLVVVLAAVLVSGLLWRQQVQIRRVENQRQSEQARWVSRGAFDWTRLILRSAADTAPVTYLGGVWSVPIAQTKLSDFLGRFGQARADEGASTWLSGSIDDAQGKFNLRNLVTGSGASGVTIDPVALAQLSKLFGLLNVNAELAAPVAAYVRASLLGSATRNQKAATSNAASAVVNAAQSATPESQGFSNDAPGLSSGVESEQATRPIPIHSIEALLDISGFTPAILERIAPFVTVLPAPTQLNLNTASPEVIAASITALPLTGAQAFVNTRDQAFLINIADAQARLGRFIPSVNGSDSTIDASRFDVTTNYFLVHGKITHERAVVDRTALIFRDPLDHSTHILAVWDGTAY